MKKPYQIEAQRAVRQLEEMATDGNAAVQMVLPMARDGGLAAPGRGRVDSSRGFCVVMGPKVPIERPCVRTTRHGLPASRWWLRWASDRTGGK